MLIKIKQSIRFRMYKVMIFYYRHDLIDSIFTLVLDGFDKVILGINC
jgi:hypothetical protein